MDQPPPPPTRDPASAARAELTRFVSELKSEYLTWYERSVGRCKFWYATLQLVSLLASLVTSVLAALNTAVTTSDEKALKYALVVLPILGSFAATCFLQFHTPERLQLREEGRIAFQDLELEGRRLLAAASNDTDCLKALEQLQTRASELERHQSKSFFELARQQQPPPPQQQPPPQQPTTKPT